MACEFTFGLENEFMLLDSVTYAPRTRLNFFELREILLGIPVDPTDIAGFKEKEPNKCNKPYYIEGYDYFFSDRTIHHTEPKGIEIRTPVRVSMEGMMSVYHTLYDTLRASLESEGFGLCLISHHPTKTNFHGPRAWRKYEDWKHEQGAFLTYGPDINVGLPNDIRLNRTAIETRLYHYASAIVAFGLNSPVYQGNLWGGKSIRILKRADTGPVFKYHPKQNRWEFKNLDVSFSGQDIENYTLLFLAVLIGENLPGSSDKEACRQELKSLAKFGWNSEIMTRAEILLDFASSHLQRFGMKTDSLCEFRQRLQSRSIPADVTAAVFSGSKSVQDFLARLSHNFTDLRIERESQKVSGLEDKCNSDRK